MFNMLESVKKHAEAFSEELFLTVLKLAVVVGQESGPSPGSLSFSLWWRVQSKQKENMLRKRRVGKGGQYPSRLPRGMYLLHVFRTGA